MYHITLCHITLCDHYMVYYIILYYNDCQAEATTSSSRASVVVISNAIKGNGIGAKGS